MTDCFANIFGNERGTGQPKYQPFALLSANQWLDTAVNTKGIVSVTGSSGAGKSVLLAHMAAASMQRTSNVCYIDADLSNALDLVKMETEDISDIIYVTPSMIDCSSLVETIKSVHSSSDNHWVFFIDSLTSLPEKDTRDTQTKLQNLLAGIDATFFVAHQSPNGFNTISLRVSKEKGTGPERYHIAHEDAEGTLLKTMVGRRNKAGLPVQYEAVHD